MEACVAVKLPYFRMRNGVWEFRRRIPKDIAHKFAKREFLHSFGTGDRRKAEDLYWEYANGVNRWICRTRDRLEIANNARKSFEDADVRDIVDRWAAREYQYIENNALNASSRGDDFQCMQEDCAEEIEELRSRSGGKFEREFEKLSIDILEDEKYYVTGLLADKTKHGSQYYNYLNLLRKARVAIIRYEVERRTQAYVIPGSEEDIVRKTLYNRHQIVPKTIAAVIEEFRTDKMNVKNNKSVDDIERAFRELTDLVGGKLPITQVTRDHFKELRNLLVRCPVRGRSRSGCHDMKLRELVKYGEDKNIPTMSIRNASKIFVKITAIMRFAFEEGYVTQDVTNGLTITVDKTADKDKRDAFSNADLITWFHHPLYVKNKGAGALYWLPLLAIFHGFRMEEMLQFRTDDLQVEKGVTFLDVHSRNGNHLKNAHSQRKTPLHDELVKLGFVKYVDIQKRNGETRIFSEVTKGQAKRYRQNFSQKMTRLIRGVGIDTTRTPFHSTRHTFVDACRRAGVYGEIANALGGWKLGVGTRHVYGDGFQLPEKNEAMQKIKFDDLDLSHLYP